MLPLLFDLLPGILVTLALLAGLRWAVHRSLAPERMREIRSPAALGLPCQTVRLATENGKWLFGWFIPAPPPAARAAGENEAATQSGEQGMTQRSPAVVALHGWGGNAETLLPLAQPLHAAGFALLFIDARCHGQSDEDSFASMPRFSEDLGHAIDWLRGRPEVAPQAIAAIGHSVGAGAVLLAAARRGDLAAVVSIAAFTHPASMMRRWFAAKGVPYRPIGWLMLRYVEWVIGHRFDDIAPVNTIRRVHCPVLLVHGADDSIVPVGEAHAIYAARAGEQVRLKLVGGSHDDYADLDRELPALVSFLHEQLAGGQNRQAPAPPPALGAQ